jgi:hypothetical protein
MNTVRNLNRIIAAALLSGGVAVAGIGLAAGTAGAYPRLHTTQLLVSRPTPTRTCDWGLGYDRMPRLAQSPAGRPESADRRGGTGTYGLLLRAWLASETPVQGLTARA